MKSLKTLLAISAITAAGAANATIWTLNMHSGSYFPAASGPIEMDFYGSWDDQTNNGTWHGTTNIPGFFTTLTYTQTFSMDETTGKGKLFTLDVPSCVGNTSSACMGFSNALKGAIYNTAINPANPAQYHTPKAFTPNDGWFGEWVMQIVESDSENSMPLVMQINFSCMDCEYVPDPDPIETPIPGSVWLLGSGLLGLAGAAKRRRK